MDILKILPDEEIHRRIKESGLYVSQEFTNKPKMFKFLGFRRIKHGRPSLKQVEILKRFFSWEKVEGQKIVITEIYDKPLPKTKKAKDI